MSDTTEQRLASEAYSPEPNTELHKLPVLDDTEELVFVVNLPDETVRKRVAMALKGLPKRPNRTTRLALTLKYVSSKDCEITVKDLGFGEMYPSSGKTWKELVRWDETEERKQV